MANARLHVNGGRMDGDEAPAEAHRAKDWEFTVALLDSELQRFQLSEADIGPPDSKLHVAWTLTNLVVMNAENIIAAADVQDIDAWPDEVFDLRCGAVFEAWAATSAFLLASGLGQWPTDQQPLSQ